MPVIGHLSGRTPAAQAPLVAALQEGLEAAGFTEGRNVVIEYRYGEGDYDRLPVLAAELVTRSVNVIVASALPAALAARAATSQIPIVFAVGVDAVAFGLVKILSRPEGNLTGVTSLFDPLHEKRLQLLHELVPDAKSIGFILNPKNRNAASHKEHVAAAALTLGLNVEVLMARSAGELEAAFSAAAQREFGPFSSATIRSTRWNGTSWWRSQPGIRSRRCTTRVISSLPAGSSVMARPSQTLDGKPVLMPAHPQRRETW